MGRDKLQIPPFDPEEIKQAALSMIARYGDNRKAERAAMHRQVVSGPATPGVYYWAAVAQAIRKMK